MDYVFNVTGTITIVADSEDEALARFAKANGAALHYRRVYLVPDTAAHTQDMLRIEEFECVRPTLPTG